MSTKPHVIFAATSLSRSSGGPFLSVSGLAQSVAKNGVVDVTVVGVYEDPPLWCDDHMQWSGTPIKALAYNGLRSVLPLRDALTTTIKTSSDPSTNTLVHLQGMWNVASMALALLRKPLECPLVISPRGMLEPWALAQRRIKKKVAMRLWQHGLLSETAVLHATSNMEYQNLRRLGLRNPIAIIPNGIDIPSDDLVAKAVSTHSVSGEGACSRRCVFLSRLHPKKGLPILLSAWNRLRPRGWTLHIAGAGEASHERAVVDLIRELNLRDVFLMGDLRGPAKWRFLANADLFVLPTHSENFGIAIAEAMAVGLPVITTQGTPWHVLQDKQMGWWVPADEQSVFTALHEAVSEPIPNLRARGERARLYAREEFGWDSIGHRMRACYDWVLERGPVPTDIVFT